MKKGRSASKKKPSVKVEDEDASPKAGKKIKKKLTKKGEDDDEEEESPKSPMIRRLKRVYSVKKKGTLKME